METESPEQMMKQAKQKMPLRGAATQTDPEDLMRDPEVRRQVEAQMRKQVEGWVHTKIPALGRAHSVAGGCRCGGQRNG